MLDVQCAPPSSGDGASALRLAQPDKPIDVGDESGARSRSSVTKSKALGDEWDNLGCLVFDRGGDGSFFTTIDNGP